jgi:hypothetical protein
MRLFVIVLIATLLSCGRGRPVATREKPIIDYRNSKVIGITPVDSVMCKCVLNALVDNSAEEVNILYKCSKVRVWDEITITAHADRRVRQAAADTTKK